ncbi:Uncharacterised protein [Staphylococcus intermedius NCTC 11048]|uniref:Uncharacterized protein n=1 Tax=Staphylococcus intermedius NCTC 11048 TaxID=1141106 RepID=A0A380G775_STAIN|nr:Uncharacterised protein [Staphylococcus intermedius NCTC 11048]
MSRIHLHLLLKKKVLYIITPSPLYKEEYCEEAFVLAHLEFLPISV